MPAHRRAFAFNLIAATQDIVTDGLAVRMLDARERGLANGIQVGAYRIGMMFGGGLLLRVFAMTNWTVDVRRAWRALLALTMIPVLPMREPARVLTGGIATATTALGRLGAAPASPRECWLSSA